MAASSTASAHEDASTKDHASSDVPVSAGADSTNRHALAHRDNAGDRGRTSIADIVVAKVAGIAAREIDGVHDLGGATERAVGRVRDVLPGTSVSTTQGIEVEVGEHQAAVDVSIVAEYGVAIHQLAAAVRRNVISAIEQMTGLEVTEVNVTVHDIAFDDDNDQNDAAPRAQ